ncbi:dihydroorotase [Colwellia sp. 1_MG-2023]|uniref:dihydroorotase n=1 Tax=unclassified Colwellia TaxID=196834 RepID=UPI001C097D98|nr:MULTISPECIES: dihydroorotase [unclassified Colwellia]MBU2926013.1 dihydroorotase [Colwellia sp. C2M11]MDO6653153.1 dihydroorotase [Colwellia sp. 3_MG-2023]MDO6666094.1 dihydroorotase [Colwellia sp. 2_MG-2023]MDO6690420.1 dihydroorotase [Colwellia sp. 1_MG-2023]
MTNKAQANTENTLTITRPDDWHVHLRDGLVLKNTVADISRYFARAIVMPNLVPPVTDAKLAKSYHDRIMAVAANDNFKPLMVLYLTDQTSAQDIIEAKESGLVFAAKLYPAGATTNSSSGVTDIAKMADVFAAMQSVGMPLLIHGEVTDCNIDIFDREQVFIDTILSPLVANYPNLKVVLEHITTKNAVDFVKSASNNVAATITVHHLLYNRNDMLVGGIRPHYFCLPILKRNIHQQALIEAATSGSAKFFLGTDSAPHAQHAKESACGCAGVYSAHAAIELYAEVFEQENALDKLEAFASLNGPEFYQLPINTDKITLVKKSWKVPATMSFGDDVVVPVRADDDILWQVKD